MRRFEWSGRNSVSARAKAAEQLAQELETLASIPDSKLVIIGHSHGGNVALSALKASGAGHVGDKIAGIVCLSTPFLLLRRRRDSFAFNCAAFWCFVVMTLALMAAVSRVAAVDPLSIVGVLLAICAGVVIYVGKRMLERSAHGLAGKLALPRIPEGKLLIVRAPDDEASGVMISFQFLGRAIEGATAGLASWIVWIFLPVARVAGFVTDGLDRVGSSVRSVLRLALRHERWTWGFLGLFFLFATWVSEQGGYQKFVPDGIGPVSPAMLSWLFILPLFAPLVLAGLVMLWTFVIGALYVVTLIVGVIVAIPFGLKVFILNPFYRIAVEPAPAGRWSIYQLEPGLLGYVEALAHSSVYEDEGATKLIAEWISTR